MIKLTLSKVTILTLVATLAVACNAGEAITAGGTGGTQSDDVDFGRVVEFTPAPGQFVNDTLASGYTGEERTPDDAAAYAERRLREGNYVSLGGFGGYITLAFDHNIINTGGFNIAIAGNQTESSSEAGIVWVMCDENGNGEPDEVWYELCGSASGNDADNGVRRGYEVTYYRPTAAAEAVRWTDNYGESGEVSYIAASHRQDFYYPAWIDADSYTLRGTCLKPRNYDRDGDGKYWICPAYEWGYADNLGSDCVTGSKVNGLTVGVRFTLFKISNAVDASGEPVQLESIRFVKIQCGVNTSCGWLGEVSTEVCAVKDYNRIAGSR